MLEVTENPLSSSGLTEPVVLSYFESFNAENFVATANLFDPNGELQPPFESAISGRESIAYYLHREARGMKLSPHHSRQTELADNLLQIQIQGSVQTPFFSVNVAWQFVLSPAREILHLEVKLLASPEELLKLRR